VVALVMAAGPAWGAAPVKTTIAETQLTGPSGDPATGTIVITATAAFNALSGARVDTNPKTVKVINGRFSVALEPNDTGVPAGTQYSIVWQLDGARPRIEKWTVTTTALTLRVGDVVSGAITAAETVSLAQVAQGGATAGQAPVWSGTAWVPATLVTGVSSVHKRTGAVVAASGDYTSDQVTEGSTNLYFTALRAQTAMSGLYEVPLTFGSPLSRTVNTISCPTCVLTGGSYSDASWLSFTAAGGRISGFQTTISGAPSSWPSTFAPAAHNLLSTYHGDAAASTPLLGGLMYANVTPAWAQLAGNTAAAKKFLVQTGTGAISAAPGWGTIEAADVPALGLASTPLTARGDVFVATGATPVPGRLAKGTQYQTLQGGATEPGYDALHLDQATAITGILPMANLAAQVPVCTKYTVATSGGYWTVNAVQNAALAAALTQTITVASNYVPANGQITALRIKHSTAFSGTEITAMTASLGDGTTVNIYAPAFDVFQAAGAAILYDDGGAFASTSAQHSLSATFTSAGGNLSAIAAGAVDLWACTRQLP
jgi:hypothetical protein